ncbi:MAG TPA: hypothetical protein VEB41_07110 [Burkholderiales bacterium]|nr:hypothetical protein [Burkholderiales bacterium]
MALIRKFFRFMRPLRKVRGYTEEVLYAGWVDVPTLKQTRR